MQNFGNVLITGGAGFLGSQLTLALLDKCDHISVVDDLSTGKREVVPQFPNIHFIEGSILDEALMKEILPNIDYIFHFACANLVNSVTNIERDFTTNLLGGYKMLQYAKEYSPKLKKFVYASTASVYGQANILPTEENYHNIKLPYSASKFSVEHYTHVFHYLYDLPVITLRFSNVYGPGQLSSNPYCGVVAKFFQAVYNKEPFTIFGDGKQTRDFTFVDDAIRATLAAALSPYVTGDVFNVGTGVETSINELAEKIMKVTNYNGEIRYMTKRSVDIVNRRSVNISRIKEKLQWHPETSLIAGLTKTYQWLQGGNANESLPRDD